MPLKEYRVTLESRQKDCAEEAPVWAQDLESAEESAEKAYGAQWDIARVRPVVKHEGGTPE